MTDPAAIAEQLRPNVTKGASLLDEKEPGWHGHIDLGELEMVDPCGCIVGQLRNIEPDQKGDTYARERAGLSRFHDEVQKLCGSNDVEYGFNLGVNSEPEDYIVLGELWKHEVLLRRQAVTA